MTGVLEETAKAAGGVIDALRGSPVALAMGIMNIALLLFLFYYLSRITTRTEVTVQALFTSQDKLFTQWSGMMKDQNSLTEKTMHCILPEDVERLMRIPSRPAGPERPTPLERPAAPDKPAGPDDNRAEVPMPKPRPLEAPSGAQLIDPSGGP
jgi:hypothetical protein